MSSDPPRDPKDSAHDMLRLTEESLGELEAENASLRTQVDSLRQERVRLEEKLSSADVQMTNLVNLCVASHRLHETADRRALLDIIREIINNIVGSEELGIFELDAERSMLSLVHSMGIEPDRFQSIPLDQGVIGYTALTGERFVAGEGPGPRATGSESNLTACIPLRCGSRVWGVIAIFGLLPQKPTLKDGDRELFALLENQAGLVLAASETEPDGNRS
ncbi:GAF domain-containing protein [Archangium violaceum]|uniref:GAF domain-containing protein n=1 Tax=Archangium violaceum TaxID=83451 RepID=UPI00193AFBDE|nr:GAF domain-containing protein [Archangium violaceum]QRK12802.1 GAF domain-containing protein [Archangium violaceum]